MKTEINFKTDNRILIHNIHSLMNTHFSVAHYSLLNLNDRGISDCTLKIESESENTVEEIRAHVKKLIEAFN